MRKSKLITDTMPDPMTKAFHADKVAIGAALLDTYRPDWWREIATDKLAMQSCNKCILGQLYGEYYKGWYALLSPLDSQTLHRCSDYGFTLRTQDQNMKCDKYATIMARFAALADAWRDAIRARSEAATHKPEATDAS